MAENIAKGSITISMDTTGKFVASPDPGVLNRNIQWMQWSLDAPEGWSFLSPGITFEVPEEGDTSFDPWPGDVPQAESPFQIRAFVNYQVPHHDPLAHYKYDFHLQHVTGTILHARHDLKIDPDMENQPQP